VKMRIMPTLRPTSPIVMTTSPSFMFDPSLFRGRRLLLAGTALSAAV
jgi:hypothetical protein